MLIEQGVHDMQRMNKNNAACAKTMGILVVCFLMMPGLRDVARADTEQADTEQADTEQAETKEAQEPDITDAFEQLLERTHGYLYDLTEFSARGVLETSIEQGGEAQKNSYAFSLSKHGPGRLAISVYGEEDEAIIVRLLSSGRQGSGQMFLPREINLITIMARIHEQPEGLTVPAVLMFYDFLEYSKPERWWNMLAEGRVTNAAASGETALNLDMVFNAYHSFRDLSVQMLVHNALGDTPRLAGLHMDLSTVFREMPGMVGANDDTIVSVNVTLDNWTVDAPPAQDFAFPVPRPRFQSVEIEDVFALASGRLPASPVAGGRLPTSQIRGGRIPPSLMSQLESLPKTPASARALLRQFQALPRAEQRRIIMELRNSPAGANLRARARQMGLTEQDLRRLKSLIEQ